MQNNGKEQRMTKNRIGVFCAASEQIDPLYIEKAEELGAWIGSQGKWLVYGGSNLGLMEATAKAVKANGGQVMGVVPTLLEERGRVSTLLDVIFPTVNLSDRKDLMLQEADILVALPGGIGTLDEIFHVLAAGSLGYHDKQVILYNVDAPRTGSPTVYSPSAEGTAESGRYFRAVGFIPYRLISKT